MNETRHVQHYGGPAKSRHQSPLLGRALRVSALLILRSRPQRCPVNASVLPWCSVSQPSRYRRASFSPRARNSRCELSRNVAIEAYLKLTIHWPKRAESTTKVHRGGSPSRARARSPALTCATAALVSGAHILLTCMSVFRARLCKILPRRSRPFWAGCDLCLELAKLFCASTTPSAP